MLNSIVVMVLSLVLGAMAGCLLALFMGGPTRAGKNPPLLKRLAPACLSLLLLFFVLSLAQSLSGKTLLELAILLASFGITLVGTTLGLNGRDEKLLELASVFRIPALSRMRYIDLPACKKHLLVSLCLGAVVSLCLGQLILTMKGGAL